MGSSLASSDPVQFPAEKAFRFKTGESARNLQQFRDIVAASSDELVQYHRTHFHFWLGEVAGQKALANEARQLGIGPEEASTVRATLLAHLDEHLRKSAPSAVPAKRH